MEKDRIVRRAVEADMDDVMKVIAAAKGIMRSSGNMKQWVNGYPDRAAILSDMEKEGAFVVEEKGRVIGYFAFLPSPEPTYAKIYEGKWLNDDLPYHVVHRIASYPGDHHVFADIMEFCFSKDGNIRIDTHEDNLIMQHNILKLGFSYCGIIYLLSGDPRLAYQRL
ncbi:MAG: N-acetyltransferase [Bacteroidales bacterium]|nr:N-acetyltransferase [Bacteroidales bacterium]